MRLQRAFLLVLLVAGCTNSGTQQNAGAPRPANVAHGTILSVHAVPATARLAVWRLLSRDAAPAAAGAKLAEFIVREDDGATISIVQDNGLGLRAGDRVDIVQGERAHLTRA